MQQIPYEKLRRAWALRLIHEHHSICWAYNLQLSRPLFEIVDSAAYLGSWDASTRKLRIATQLIVDHSWDIVVQVLKHEMAHQFVSEIFQGDGDHGPLFHKACDLIGLPGPFRSASGDLPTGLPVSGSALPPQGVQYLDKVRKLLRLAESSNEHEALLAMEKARELMEKYNLDIPAPEQGRHLVYRILNPRRKRLERYHISIVTILTDFFFIKAIFCRLYDARDNEVYRATEILGTEENVEVAEYVYHFLLHHLALLWRDRQRETGCAGREKNSFFEGILHGFRNTLETQERQRQYKTARPGQRRSGETISSLVVSSDQELASFFKSRHPRIKTTASGRMAFHEGSWEAGRQAGAKLVLHHGLRSGQEREGVIGYLTW